MANIVFRILREDENVENGICAKNPNANKLLADFLANGRNGKSQFIATSTDLFYLLERATKDNCTRIAAINLERLHDCKIYDVSSVEKAILEMKNFPGETNTKQEGYYRKASWYASKAKEIDIVGVIPKSAYLLIEVEELKDMIYRFSKATLSDSKHKGIINLIEEPLNNQKEE